MSYQDTFIQIAPDSSATEAVIPADDRPKKTIHRLQYELLTEKPYHYTHEEFVFEVYRLRQGIDEETLAEDGDELRADFHKKEHPCMRASALTKKYGWGAHHNDEGKIALVPIESEDYQTLSEQASKNLLAMRTSRKK